MCGITGFTWEDKKLIKQMTAIMVHRGPDQHGFYTDSKVSLGHRRLSIIDLSERARQPMENEDGSIIVIYNGEIYNYKELRSKLIGLGHSFSSNSDTEVLVHGYEEWGEELPKRLNGIFAFCIYDRKGKKLFLARDNLGVKPLYYYDTGKHFIFGSEIKSILLAGVPRKVDAGALHEYLSFRYVSGEKTMFANIKKLLPGHYLAYDLKTRRKKTAQYWKIAMQADETPEKDSAYAERLLAQLKKSVEMQLMSDVPLGVFLSGGIDSSAMVGLMHELGVDDIKTFAIGFTNYDDKAEEMKHARIVADYFGTDHHEFIINPDALDSLPAVVWHMDEPVGVDTSIPTYLLSKFTRPHVTVTLSGEGGDEAFGGYVQYSTLKLAEKLIKPFPGFIRRGIMAPAASIAPVSFLTKFFKYPGSIGTEGRQRLVDLIRTIDDRAKSYVNMVSIFSYEEKRRLYSQEIAESVEGKDIVKEVHKKYFDNSLVLGDQIFLRENTTFLPDFVLSRLDKMTMAWSLESRVPLLDKDLVELVSTIPRHLKKNKRVFRMAMKDILPKQIAQRKKTPFYLPIESWYSKGLNRIGNQVLSAGEPAIRKYFRMPVIKKLLEKPVSSMPHSRQLWALLNFALWHKLYIEQNLKKPPKSFDKLY
ncbi:MAG: asparagine synthase (glutamine-hydrolyzing) [Candidatus Woesearchaeota archaeon]